MNVYGKKIILRAIEENDLDLLQEMLNDPNMENCVVGWSFPISKFQQRKWFESNFNSKDLRFIIETMEKETIGIATLINIDWKNRSATHGIKLVSSNIRQKGLGTDTVMTVMRYAFDELQLNRLEGSWFPENIASKKLYMKLGWKVEGVKKQYAFKQGKYRDLEISAILRNEYYKMETERKYWEN